MRILLFSLFVLSGTVVVAQDSTRKREVQVTSQFKPVLKDAAKINLNASPPTVDTSKPRLQYNIPAQNLVLGYQPGSLKPLALANDTTKAWENSNYIKGGYGMFNTGYFEMGASLGDGIKAGANAFVQHVSAKGNLPYQKFSNTDVTLTGFTRTGNNLKWNGKVAVTEDRWWRWGYEPKTLRIPEDSLRLRYQSFTGRIGFQNVERTALGISYAPEFEISTFTDQLRNREAQAYVNIPFRKTFEGKFEIDVRAEGNFIRFDRRTGRDINNNWVAIAPSFLAKTRVVDLQAGIRPAWDNGEFHLLPNIVATIGTADNRFSLQAGFVGYIRANSFRYLTDFNPWIYTPTFSNNSIIREYFAGIKGSLTPRFNYNIRGGYNRITNQVLYINDTATGKGFNMIVEPEISNINITGSMGYTAGEKFSLQSTLALNNYFNIDATDKPWGLLPLEFRTTVRLQIIKDLYLRGDLWAFDRPWFQTKSDRGRLKGGADLSAGLEFAIVKNVKLWAQFNNLLNSEYQRWKQYPVLPFNVLGGVVFSFNQKPQ